MNFVAADGLNLFHAVIHLQRVVELMDIGVWSYLVLFGLLFSCGLGMPLPEDIPLLVAGMLIGAGKMHLVAAATCAWCGIIGGDCVLYYLGHRYGLNITRVPYIGKHVTRDRIMQAERLFARWGIWVVAVGRLFAGVRGAMVVAAGTIRFNFIKFLIADGLAAVVSGGLFVWLGIKFGENLTYIQHKIHRYGTLILWCAVVIVAGFIAVQFWRKRGHRGPSELAADTIEHIADHGIHIGSPPPQQQPNPPHSQQKNAADSPAN
jgi:membrane protein DedA with SNARE-associated domain